MFEHLTTKQWYLNTLPNAHLAIVPIEKLRDYSLNPESVEGRHKARVFLAALGLRRGDAEWLQSAILVEVVNASCRPGPSTSHGTKYVVDMRLSRDGKSALVRTAWLIRLGQEASRLVTAFVLPSRAWQPKK